MDARQRWQALQRHLTASRARLDEGNFAAALQEVDAALAIDANFLAAQSLRDRIVSLAPNLSMAYVAPVATRAADLPEQPLGPPPVPTIAETTVVPDELLAPAAASGIPDDLPLVIEPAMAAERAAEAPAAAEHPVRLAPPADGYARFEQRARRRRVDRLLVSARSALSKGRLKEAASAIDEVTELDPNLPELREMTLQYAQLRQHVARPHAGRWLVAAATFGGVLLGASWLHDATGLWSRQTVAVSTLVAPPEPFAVTVSASEIAPDASLPVATVGANSPVKVVDRVPERVTLEPRDLIRADRQTDVRPAETRVPEATVALSQVQTPVTRLMPEPVGVVNSLGVVAPVGPATIAPVPPPPPAATVNSVVRTPDDEASIKQVLQRYRTAYEGLDARSARAVWPAVNETALARAFDGLASQALTFEACDVRLRGDIAAATCRGSARYVPKVGSHEPRIEPRTWSFTLKRNGIDWQIESARAER